MRRSPGAVPSTPSNAADGVDQGPTLVESALRHDRAPLAVLLILIPLACWWWIVVMARDMYGPMRGASAWMMTPSWDAPHVILLWAMWAVMMTGMMLPSASPTLVIYGAAARRRDGAGAARHVYALAAGYLVVWALFSVGATALQRTLAALLLVSPMMELTSPTAGAVLLLVAGAYQLTPLKRTCLKTCQSPLGFLMRHWRTGLGQENGTGRERGGCGNQRHGGFSEKSVGALYDDQHLLELPLPLRRAR